MARVQTCNDNETTELQTHLLIYGVAQSMFRHLPLSYAD